jgi:hypothetical protein
MGVTGLLRRHAGTLLALAFALSAVFVQQHRQFDPHIRWDRFSLPGFDAYAYVAMAEHPQFFTVAPWGYRVLTPWLVAALPGVGPARGFYYVTWAALAGAGVFLFLWLRRLGHGPAPALLGVLALGFSPPALDALKYPFVADPLCLLLLLAFLFAFEAGAGLGVLSLLAVLGALSKEILLLPLPLLVIAACASKRGSRAWPRAALAALPAIIVTLALRRYWVPHLPAGSQTPEWASLARAIGLIVAAWREWLPLIALGGLLPLALLGALRRRARPFLSRYGYLIVAFGALPFAASVYVGPADQPAMFFSGDIARLTLHLVPFLIALALIGLDRLWPHITAAPVPRLPAAPWQRVAAACALVLTLFPFFFLDRYRRIDLSSTRDGLVVLATTRESLRTAERLERGAHVTFTPEAYRFVPRKSEAPQMGLMRWFLREGWGFQAYYDVKDMRMQAREARILLPCLAPRDSEIVLRLAASSPEQVEALVNDRQLGTVALGASGAELRLHVPAALLFRGDNILTLRRGDDSRLGPRVLALTVGP